MRRAGGVLVYGVAMVLTGLLPTGTAGAAKAVPDAAAWRAAIAGGTELTVPVEGRTIAISPVEDTDLFAAGALPAGLVPFRAALAAGGWVRGAVKDDVVVANAWAPDLGLVSIAPKTDGTIGVVREAAASVRAAGVDTVIEPEGTETGETCDSLLWQPRVASPTSLLEEDPLRTYSSAFAVDSSYASAVPSWEVAATATIAAVDQLFRTSFQVRIAVVHLIEIPDLQVFGSTTNEMLNSLQGYYTQNYPALARENAHLITGRDPTNAAGQVNCVGSAGRTTLSYSVSQGIPGGPYIYPGGLIMLPDGAMKIAAHELAHTLSAHHHYANCVEPATIYDPFVTLDACTVMINDWGLIAPIFSSLEKLTVRGWVDHYDI